METHWLVRGDQNCATCARLDPVFTFRPEGVCLDVSTASIPPLHLSHFSGSVYTCLFLNVCGGETVLFPSIALARRVGGLGGGGWRVDGFNQPCVKIAHRLS